MPKRARRQPSKPKLHSKLHEALAGHANRPDLNGRDFRAFPPDTPLQYLMAMLMFPALTICPHCAGTGCESIVVTAGALTVYKCQVCEGAGTYAYVCYN